MIDNREEFRNIANATEQMTTAFADFLTALLKRQGFIEDFDAYDIVKYVSEGGSTIQTCVSLDRVDLMSELLRKEHVSYLCVNNTDPQTGDINTIFIMKNERSVRNAFSVVQQEFQLMLDTEKKEIPPQSFVSLFKEQNIGVVDNLTPEEVLAFRNVSKHYDMRYAVASGEKRGTHSIYCSNPRMLKEAMIDVAYNFSQKKGQEYEAALHEYVTSTDNFKTRALNVPQGKTLYVVDAKDPRHFISITSKNFTSHSVNMETERMPGGVTRDVLADTMHKTYDINKTDELLTMSKSMRTPVFLSEQEFNLVSGIAKSGEAILADEFTSRFEKLKESLQKAKSILKKEPVHKNALEYQEVSGYVHLPKDVIRTLEQMEIEDLTIVNRDISFPKSKQHEIDGILEALLYLDMKPLERREAELFYKGAGDLVISKAPTDPQYILNPDNPSYVIKNEDKGLSVFVDDKQDMFIARDTPDFSTTAIAIIESIKHPVILSEAEMFSEEKKTIIEYRTYDNVDNEAHCALRFAESLEKQELHVTNPEKYGDLSETQKEALERSKKYEINEKTMDAKTGKELTDKRLEKLLNRQKQQEMSQSPDM